MAQLVTQNASQLILVQDIGQGGVYCHSGMLRIAAGSKGIRHRTVNNINLGHRNVGLLCQLFHDAVKLRCAASIYLLGVVVRKHHFITVPIGVNIHGHTYKEHKRHALQAAEEVTDKHQQSSHQGHQHSCFHM